MKCEFSEMQFTFGILREMTEKLNPTKGWFTPIIPKQADEKNLGYDCKLSGPINTLFFQFKVPRRLERSNAKYWIDFSSEYYEFKIWPDSLTGQHNRLVELGNANKRNKVFYCSPAFIKQEEYDSFYKNNSISINSIMVECKSLSKISGNDKHVITYKMNPRIYHMHSDDQQYDAMNYYEFINYVKESKPYENLEECLNMLGDEFNITLSDSTNLQRKLNSLAYELLIKYDLFLLLF